MKRFSKTRSVDHAGALRDAQRRHQLRLHVGREAGIRRGHDARRRGPARAGAGARGSARVSISAPHSRSLSSVDSRFAGDRRRPRGTSPRVASAAASSVPASIRSPDTRWRTPRSDAHAAHHDPVGAGAAHVGAHLQQHLGELDDLGLARGVLDHRLALGEARRHHHVLGAVHGREVEGDARAAQPRGARLDVAVVEAELGAERLEALQVLIDRAHADRAAARLRDARRAEARDQRSEHQERGAHLAHQVVGGLAGCGCGCASMRTLCAPSPCHSARAPSARRISSMASTSRSHGTFSSTRLAVARAAPPAISASVEFFEPETATSPRKRSVCRVRRSDPCAPPRQRAAAGPHPGHRAPSPREVFRPDPDAHAPPSRPAPAGSAATTASAWSGPCSSASPPPGASSRGRRAAIRRSSRQTRPRPRRAPAPARAPARAAAPARSRSVDVGRIRDHQIEARSATGSGAVPRQEADSLRHSERFGILLRDFERCLGEVAWP